MVDAQTIINETETISPRGSLKGYNLLTALKRNKDSIKLFLAIIGAINIVPPFNWKSFFLTLGVGFITLIVKIIMDLIDFVSNDVELKK